ncbi:hypothetical protein DFH08DRAFT_824677 [Mycena albidolilacea]|uniref:Uncharacterized protein n=1 Tax=Mycena albidolilacea TaxID=1033008 RepID=A0AAD6Z3N4_9AGAR|nr:hypothetical protein DFH08DRAFT_824677 [Mycena albidolilacea]
MLSNFYASTGDRNHRHYHTKSSRASNLTEIWGREYGNWLNCGLRSAALRTISYGHAGGGDSLTPLVLSLTEGSGASAGMRRDADAPPVPLKACVCVCVPFPFPCLYTGVECRRGCGRVHQCVDVDTTFPHTVWVQGRVHVGSEDVRASSASRARRRRRPVQVQAWDERARSTLHRGDGVLLHSIDLVAHHGDTEVGHVLLAHGGLGADVVP